MRGAGVRAAAAALFLSGVSIIWLLRAERSLPAAIDWAVPSASGDRVAVGGRAGIFGRSRRVFFLNAATGTLAHAGPRISAGGTPPTLSPDARWAAWTVSRLTLRGETGYVARVLEIGSARGDRRKWDASPFREAPLIVFDDSATRIALITSDSISVREVKTGRVLVEAHPRQPLWLWGSRGFTTATFVNSDRVRVYRARSRAPVSREWELDILDLDVAGPALSPVGHAGPFPHVFPLVSDSRRERLLVRTEAGSVLLLDARSGRTIRNLAEHPADSRSADFLSDGRIALFESAGDRESLRLLDGSGSLVRGVPLGPGQRAFFVGEPRAGFLDVAVAFAAGLPRRDARIVRVDLASGTAETIADHLLPVTTFSRWTCGDPGRRFAPGSEATRLYSSPAGSLVELDGRTRRVRTILGGSAPR